MRLTRCALVALACSLLFDSPLCSQEQSFSKFRVLLKSPVTNARGAPISPLRFEGRDGTLSATTLTGRLDNGTLVTIDRDQIRRMDVSSGNKLLKGAAIGTGLGATCWLAMAAADAANTNTSQGSYEASGLGLVGGGALIGALIGMNYTRWREFPLLGNLELQPNTGQAGLTVRISY